MNDVLLKLLRELLDGPPDQYCFVLNPGDPGLLRSLDRLSAEEASRIPPGGRSSVAAHVDHLRYGLSLGNRWARGEEDAFATADFSGSWTKTTVNDDEWVRRRGELRQELSDWTAVMERGWPDEDIPRMGMAAIVIHLAYHLGAMRQIAPMLAGPLAND